MFIGLNELVTTLFAKLSPIIETIQAFHALDMKVLKVFNNITAVCKIM